MKTTARTLTLAINGLSALMAAVMPATASYYCGQLVDEVQSKLNQLNKAKEKAFKDAGCTLVSTMKAKEQQTVDGVTTEVEVEKPCPQYWHHDDPAVMEAVNKQLEDLMDTEVTVIAARLDLAMFADVKLPGNTFVHLLWAIKKPDEPKAA